MRKKRAKRWQQASLTGDGIFVDKGKNAGHPYGAKFRKQDPRDRSRGLKATIFGKKSEAELERDGNLKKNRIMHSPDFVAVEGGKVIAIENKSTGEPRYYISMRQLRKIANASKQETIDGMGRLQPRIRMTFRQGGIEEEIMVNPSALLDYLETEKPRNVRHAIWGKSSKERSTMSMQRNRIDRVSMPAELKAEERELLERRLKRTKWGLLAWIDRGLAERFRWEE